MTLNTVKYLEKGPIFLAASIDPRYRNMKCMAVEDSASVQEAVQVLSIKEAKESHITGDSAQEQKTTNVQAQKSALDSDSQTENSDKPPRKKDPNGEEISSAVPHTRHQLVKMRTPFTSGEGGNEKSCPTLAKLVRSVRSCNILQQGKASLQQEASALRRESLNKIE